MKARLTVDYNDQRIPKIRLTRSLVVLLSTLLIWPSPAWAAQCTSGQPCGDSCISWYETCHIGGKTSDDTGVIILSIALSAALIGVLVYIFSQNERSTSNHHADTGRNFMNLPPESSGEPDGMTTDEMSVYALDACAITSPCKIHGLCTDVGGGTGTCAALTDLDCQQSKECHLAGRCKASAGKCVKQ
jgi:hypothetical protein